MLHNYFKHIYVINLDRRDDRMAGFLSQIERIGLKYPDHVTRISGVDGSEQPFANPLNIPHFHPGDIGCTLSHLRVVQAAKLADNPYYLVLEDDVLFRPGFKEAFSLYWPQVPAGWDMVYLGANHNNQALNFVNSNVIRVKGSYTTHAMVIRHTMYDELIRVWSEPNKQVDVLLSELHEKFNCYSLHPNLAGQRAGRSDILNRDVNYDFLLNG